MKKFAEAVLNYHYTPSYIVKRDDSQKWTPEELQKIALIRGEVIHDRMNFYDFVGLLHCSIKFSPYLRLPILGSNVNAELSFVGIKNLHKLNVAKSKRDTIRKTMEKIGRSLAQKTMSKSTANMLEHMASQLVVMTDLPIEWTIVNDVPLGFTHDICRIPETPVTGMLSQYVSSCLRPYTIPTDIIEKTLVVFGNRDEIFVEAQQMVLDLQTRLHFKIEVCLSKKEFYEAIDRHAPEFLIMDCHGGVDENTKQTYLRIGNEILTGADVVSHKIHPELVFLSACNTFPTYNTISTIANAFFETGSLAVTTSYMPLEVKNATILYTWLLTNLAEAATRYKYFNWLAFISCMLRTSYIYSPLSEKPADDKMESAKKILAELARKSSYFEKRRELYKNLNTNSFTKNLGVSYDYIIPHYLMYSTLGRADLIRFQVAIDKIVPDLGTSNQSPLG